MTNSSGMPVERENVLCQYCYDPLDRLVACTPTAQTGSRRFYLKERLSTEIQGSAHRSIFQQGDLVLAQQQQQNGAVKTTLLATDQQRSVLHALNKQMHPLAYTPYGHRVPESGLLSLLGFNGERQDPVTGHYLLGNGYRAFNTALMRFNSPDSMSPFGKGGLNAYAYCAGDPINWTDTTGHFPSLWRGLLNFFNRRSPRNFATTHVAKPTLRRQATIAGSTSSLREHVFLDHSLTSSKQAINSVAKNPLYQSSNGSVVSQSSRSVQSGSPTAASNIHDPADLQYRPLPAPPANARLHTDWSMPEPRGMGEPHYEQLQPYRRSGSTPQPLTVSPDEEVMKMKTKRLINAIGLKRYERAQAVIRNGLEVEWWRQRGQR
ncbi:RHS repeat-associated core domain-containing protein [Pseudomonas sp. SMN5]|uniref:RHS repeat-associated core domain-containing protein n=1 Tax=Pseudomonas sp. SMN5 TaxID=3390198 RepID=UPI003F87198D